MKLHLTKSLRAALIACVCGCMVGQAVAADRPDSELSDLPDPTDGRYWLGSGPTKMDNANGLDIYLDSATNGNHELHVKNGDEISVKMGVWHDDTYGGNEYYTKSGTGTLIVTGKPDGANYLATNTATVSDGTLKVGFEITDSNVLVRQGVEVQKGATLAIANKSDGIAMDITLIGAAGEGNTATLNLGGNYQVLTGDLALKGNTLVEYSDGTYGLVLDGSAVSVTGVNNEIVTTLALRRDTTIDVAAEGELTLSAKIQANPYGDDAAKADLSKVITKTGAGTLTLGADPGFSSATDGKTYTVGLDINEGILDLTETGTFTLASLDLATGTTIKLGANTRINFTDSLTIDSGVIFDVSSWCDYDSFNPYELFAYTGEGTFDTSNITTGFVTIHTSMGDNEKAFLTVSGNSVTLVPEPTTATLSLLALAGLAARRRRK